jgi:hypothetical protein
MKKSITEAIRFSRGVYPKALVKYNRMGHIEAWPGENAHGEAPVYIQSQDDVDQILSNLPKSEREHLEKGYDIITKNFPDEYFGMEEGSPMKKSINESREEWALLVDSLHGIHCPQIFVQKYGHLIQNKNELADDLDILKHGNGSDEYWDAWDAVEREAVLKIKGKKYTVHQDEDIWAVPEGFDWDTIDEGATMKTNLQEFRNFIKKDITMHPQVEALKQEIRNRIFEMTTSSNIAIGSDVMQGNQMTDVIPAGELDGTEEELPQDVHQIEIDPLHDTAGDESTRDTGTSPYKDDASIPTQEDIEMIQQIGSLNESEYNEFVSKLTEAEIEYINNTADAINSCGDEASDSGTEVEDPEGLFYQDDGQLYDVEDCEDTVDEIEVDPIEPTTDDERGNQIPQSN